MYSIEFQEWIIVLSHKKKMSDNNGTFKNKLLITYDAHTAEK